MEKDKSSFTDKYTAEAVKSKKASIKWVAGWLMFTAIIGGLGVVVSLVSRLTGNGASVAAIVVSALVMLFAIGSRKKIISDPAGSKVMLIAWLVGILVIATANNVLMPSSRPPGWSIIFVGAFAYALYQHREIYGKQHVWL